MVGRDGRNLLRVKKRWVESSSSAPPRAKYLLLMLQECGRLPVAKLLCGGIHGDIVVAKSRAIEQTGAPVSSWTASRGGRRRSQAHHSVLRK